MIIPVNRPFVKCTLMTNRGGEMDRELFEKGPVMRTILRLAVPSVAGQIILVVYNAADTYFVGLSDSPEMLAAVTLCMPAFMVLSAVSNLFGIGAASVIASSLGKGNARSASLACAFAVWGCTVLSLAYSALILGFTPFIAGLLGARDPSAAFHAAGYLRIAVGAGGLITSLSALLSHIIRATGRSAHAGAGIIIGGILNIILDPLFMFVLMPRGREVEAAAVATMISNTAALAYYALYLLIHRKGSIFSLRPSRAMFSSGIPSGIFSSGLPAFLMTLCENLSYALLGHMMASYGTAAQAGVGVARKINLLAHCTVRGIAQGVLPLIAFNYAAGKRIRCGKILKGAASLAIGVSLACAAVCLVSAGSLTGLFIDRGTEAFEAGKTFLRIMCVGAPFSAWAYTVISFFQAVGRMKHSLLLALMRKGIIDMPLMLVLSRTMGMYGIVCATPAADIICCASAIILYSVFMKNTREGQSASR